jgi:hypothetical protein
MAAKSETTTPPIRNRNSNSVMVFHEFASSTSHLLTLNTMLRKQVFSSLQDAWFETKGLFWVWGALGDQGSAVAV